MPLVSNQYSTILQTCTAGQMRTKRQTSFNSYILTNLAVWMQMFNLRENISLINKLIITCCVGRNRTAGLKTMILACYRCTTTRCNAASLSQIYCIKYFVQELITYSCAKITIKIMWRRWWNRTIILGDKTGIIITRCASFYTNRLLELYMKHYKCLIFFWIFKSVPAPGVKPPTRL